MSVELFRAVFRRLAELERQVSGSTWRGTVKEVDTQNGKWVTRVTIGKDADGNDVLSPWLPYSQIAGALKVHSPPSVGQQMEIKSSGGDIEQGTAYPLHWSDANASPSTNADDHVATFGNVKIELRDGQLKLTVGGAVVDVTTSGMKVTIGGTTFDVKGSRIDATTSTMQVTGTSLKHNAKEVGDTHVHKDVTPGPLLTGIPN